MTNDCSQFFFFSSFYLPLLGLVERLVVLLDLAPLRPVPGLFREEGGGGGGRV